MTSDKNIIYYHLPGLFEFYELYSRFIPLFYEHREYFYDWCKIGSVYGAPADCIWGGGRVGFGDDNAKAVIELLEKYDISARLTFSNSLLKSEHLNDRRCNELCRLFESENNGIIIYSDILLDYIHKHYPKFYFVSSTTKVITDYGELLSELNRHEFKYVVPDFRHNKSIERLGMLNDDNKAKVELLCNECCYIGCQDRKACYENVSRKSLGENCDDHICRAPGGDEGYRFSKAFTNPAFIGIEDIRDVYMPMGISNFKIEGRGLGSAVVLEFLLYYMTKSEKHLEVREHIYLDSMLDIF